MVLTLRKRQRAGFTIVELLIVVVVIAILAAISVVAYSGIQDRARNAKMNADLTQLEKAIQAARVNTGKVLKDITGSGCTSCACRAKSVSPDLSVLDKETDSCWTGYATALSRISTASGMSVTNLIDPWGRPYYMDENEQEQSATYGPCGIGKDSIGNLIVRTGIWVADNGRSIQYLTPGC